MTTEVNDRFYQGRTVLTETQLTDIEDMLAYYEFYGATGRFEGDVVEILTGLLPDDSAYKNVEAK